MDTPITSWPCSTSSAAATEESTPPDIATTIRMYSRDSFFTKPRGTRSIRKHWRSSCSSCSSCHRDERMMLRSYRRRLLRQPPQLLDEPRQDVHHPVDLFSRRI